MAALTKNDLRDYVLGAKRTVGTGYVLLDLTHNLTPRRFAEIQFHLETDIEDVKHRIYAHTGSKPEFMELTVNGVILEDGKLLQDYNVKDHDVIHVIDHDPDSVAANGGLDDVSQVKKYVMSEEEYAKRPNTYRAWKQEQLKKDPNWSPPWLQKQRDEAAAKKKAQGPCEPIESVQARIKLGDRCECAPGARRGVVSYIGYLGAAPSAASAPEEDGESKAETKQEDLPQVFIGVTLDEPLGKNDGTFKGKRYFKCERNYGAFVKPAHVVVGDFPVRDPFASDDEGCQPGCDHKHDKEDDEDVMEEL